MLVFWNSIITQKARSNLQKFLNAKKNILIVESKGNSSMR